MIIKIKMKNERESTLLTFEKIAGVMWFGLQQFSNDTPERLGEVTTEEIKTIIKDCLDDGVFTTTVRIGEINISSNSKVSEKEFDEFLEETLKNTK